MVRAEYLALWKMQLYGYTVTDNLLPIGQLYSMMQLLVMLYSIS